MRELLAYLASAPPGPLSEVGELDALLARYWEELEGGDAEGMSGYKLHGRMEQVVWEPPILQFSIERHGATALGSTRAEVHDWTVDVEQRSASLSGTGIRQLYPMQARLDVGPMAKEITESIVNHREDPRWRWQKDGSVRILIGKVLPADSAVKQTLEGRRRRFRQVVEEYLTDSGWPKVRVDVYSAPTT